MIDLKNIEKSYRDGDKQNQVLRGVDLAIEAGEYVALMGASGSGKTTLLNIIGGLDSVYSGQAVIHGQDISNLNDRDLSVFRNRTVSFIFQQFHLLNHLPVLQNVLMPSWFHPEKTDLDLHARAREVLDRVGLAHKIDATPNHLSGGEKQRVAIARAIFSAPKLLLCDEPTGALDSDNGKRVLDLFDELHKTDGMSVLIVTHSPSVAAHCERTIAIADGCIVAAPAKEAR
jgi:putative ABC transport system ATP-binding protein